MASAIQPQWDVGNSAFSVSGKIWGLMKAATVDDVQPASVYAIEAIGQLMIVEPHLIGRAVDALGGNKSYRIDTIKLHLGLSSGGIPSQVRLSTAATKAFILITALRLHMSAVDIGNALYEFLVESEVIEDAPVSSSQLQGLVEALEGHSLELMKTESIASKVLYPMLEELASVESSSGSLFNTMAPNDISRILLAVFRAISADEVRHLEVRGTDSAIWLVSILSWMCPHEVEVLYEDFNSRCRSWISSTTPAPKISVIIQDDHRKSREGWSLQHWYSSMEPSSLIEIKPDETYGHKSPQPTYVPCPMTYASIRHCESWKPAPTDVVGNVAYGFVLAVLDYGILTREDGEGHASPSLAFREICPDDFGRNVERTLTRMGWPSSSLDRAAAENIAQCMAKEMAGLYDASGANLMSHIDKHGAGGRLLTDHWSSSSKRRTVELSLFLAQHIVLHATQQETLDLEFPKASYKASEEMDQFPVIIPLLSHGTSLSASRYLNYAVSTFTVTSSAQFYSITKSSTTLAASARGQVRYCRGLVEAPCTPAEAFEIVSQSGQLKWRGTKQHHLYDDPERLYISTAPKSGTYRVVGDDPTIPNLASLRVYNSQKLRFSVRTSPDSSAIYLRCTQTSSGDSFTELGKALVNWALATRAEPSNRHVKEELSECLGYGISELRLKTSGYDALYLLPDFLENIMAVATYSGDAMSDFLRFGSFDAWNMHCIIQGRASIFDCISLGHNRFKKGWMIMANP